MNDDEAVMATPRRVRHEMADALLVMGFSLGASAALALCVALMTRVL
jgi:hypothetical protein